MGQRYILEADWGIAVRKINPNSQFTGTLEDITWQDGTTPISREDIQTKIDEMNGKLKVRQFGLKSEAIVQTHSLSKQCAKGGYSAPIEYGVPGRKPQLTPA